MSAARVVLWVGVVLVGGGCGHLVLLHDPLAAPEHNDLGVAYEAEGRLDLAAREYRRALRLDWRLARARVNLGNVEGARGRWAAAEREYRRALRLDARDADAMNNLAVALLRRGHRIEEARQWAGRAVTRGGPRDSIYRATLQELGPALRPGTAGGGPETPDPPAPPGP